MTISGYLILKQFTGVSIPKLEEFLGLDDSGDGGETPTVEDIKSAMVSSGAFVIKGN